MELTLMVPDKGDIELAEGLPKNLKSTRRVFALCRHFSCKEFDLVLEEIPSKIGLMRKAYIKWNKPAKILFRYNHELSLHTRLSINNYLHEFIKGVGEVHTRAGEFSSIISGASSSLFVPGAKGEHSFIEILVPLNHLRNSDPEAERVIKAHQTVLETLPARLNFVPLKYGAYIHNALEKIEPDSSGEAQSPANLNKTIKTIVGQIIRELNSEATLKNQFKHYHWEQLNKAVEAIEENLKSVLNTAQIATLVGLNEFSLKKFFRKRTGFAIDEYRKYRLCVEAGRDIVRLPHLPLKHFYTQAGYANLPNFIRAFRKFCCCAPNELRKNTWDVNSLSKDN